MNTTQGDFQSTAPNPAKARPFGYVGSPSHPAPETLSARSRAQLAAYDAKAAALDARGAARVERLSARTPLCAARARALAEQRQSNRASERRIVAMRLRDRDDAEDDERDRIDADVAAWIERALRQTRPLRLRCELAPGPISRERQAEAMRALRHSSSAKAPHLRAFLWLAMETGASANELAAARWGDFDFRRGVWKVPARETRRGRIIPLSTSAMRAMRRLELASAGQDRLFHPFGSARSATRALAAALAAAGAQPIMFRETSLQALHQLVVWHGLNWLVACAILGRAAPPNPFARYAKQQTP